MIQMLDAGTAGGMDWHGFLSLVTQIKDLNLVVDYIPLEQIVSVEFKLEPKGHHHYPHQRPFSNRNGGDEPNLHRGVQASTCSGQASLSEDVRRGMPGNLCDSPSLRHHFAAREEPRRCRGRRSRSPAPALEIFEVFVRISGARQLHEPRTSCCRLRF